MKIIILGGDGYLGWPTSMNLASKGHEILSIDNYSKRLLAIQTSSVALIPTPNLEARSKIFETLTGKRIQVAIGDLKNYSFLEENIKNFQPDAVIHYAEQPSAPYSLKGYEEAHYTLKNNLEVTHNLIWAILKNAPNCHIVKLGTMGEYGCPNIDIPEGWIDIEKNGRTDKFLFPRAAGSLYHTTKVLDTDLLWFYVRTYGLKVTDLMQGPVYGLSTKETDLDERLLPNFHYDDIFGTVINRFLVQAVAGIPLTVYGKGGQTRGFLNIKDTLQCINLAINNPANKGELKIYNQMTESFSVNELAKKIQMAGESIDIKVAIKAIENPRKEVEEHYYNPTYTGLLELGLSPHLLNIETIKEMLLIINRYASKIDKTMIFPR